MLLEALTAQKDAINLLTRQYGARHVRVFGSVARGEYTEFSDIDLLVEFPQGYDLFSQRLPLVQSLEKLLGRSVDLIPEHELNRHIHPYVLREAIDL